MKTESTYRRKDGQNFWNFWFAIFFAIVLVGSLTVLYVLYHGFPHTIPFFDAVLIALASFRITRLVVYDKVTRFFREWFVHKRDVERDGEICTEITPYTRGIRATLYQLVICPWCIGMWSALIGTLAYYAFPWAWFVVLFLAIAGVSSFVQIIANAIGWYAENLKHTATSKAAKE